MEIKVNRIRIHSHKPHQRSDYKVEKIDKESLNASLKKFYEFRERMKSRKDKKNEVST